MPTPPDPATPRRGPLLDRVGGVQGLRAAVGVFHRRLVADPQLGRHFAGVDTARLEAHQRWFLAALLGGSDVFTGHPLDVAHAGLDVTDADYDRLVEHLLTAFEDLGADGDDVVAVGAAVQGLRASVVGQQAVRRPGS